MLCDRCHQPLPVMLFPGAPKERQAVFTVIDGKRVHIGGCPRLNPPSADEE